MNEHLISFIKDYCMDCECEPDEVTTHFGWFRCTPESRALLAEERIAIAEEEFFNSPPDARK